MHTLTNWACCFVSVMLCFQELLGQMGGKGERSLGAHRPTNLAYGRGEQQKRGRVSKGKTKEGVVEVKTDIQGCSVTFTCVSWYILTSILIYTLITINHIGILLPGSQF